MRTHEKPVTFTIKTAGREIPFRCTTTNAMGTTYVPTQRRTFRIDRSTTSTVVQSAIRIQTGANIDHLRLRRSSKSRRTRDRRRRVQSTTMRIAQCSDSCSSCSVLPHTVKVQCRRHTSRGLDTRGGPTSAISVDDTDNLVLPAAGEECNPPVARASVLCVASWSRFLWKLRSVGASVVARTPTIQPMFWRRCLAVLCGRPSLVT